jgi:hypothetical protein
MFTEFAEFFKLGKVQAKNSFSQFCARSLMSSMRYISEVEMSGNE